MNILTKLFKRAKPEGADTPLAQNVAPTFDPLEFKRELEEDKYNFYVRVMKFRAQHERDLVELHYYHEGDIDAIYKKHGQTRGGNEQPLIVTVTGDVSVSKTIIGVKPIPHEEKE